MNNWNKIYQILRQSSKKYSFYEGNFDYYDYNTSKIARKFAKARVGWGRRAVEIRANKTQFDRFENDTLGLNDIFNRYRGKQAFDKIKDDILVCGVGFLVVAKDRLMPFTAEEATGTYDWYEQNLKDGLAIFKRSKNRNNITALPDVFMEFTKNETITYKNDVKSTEKNPTGRPLIGMLTYRSTTKQPFGRTVLTAPSRDAMIDASRTRRQSMVASYHYNKKVDVILGVDSDTDVDKIEAETGDVLKVGTNENGQIPQIGEFAQHALAPFNDSILQAAREFCADTKLSLHNLSLDSKAPDSPQSLEIIGDDLRDDITEWQKELGEQIKYIATTIFLKENNISSIDTNLQQKIDNTTVSWLPVYRADVSRFGDGLTKIAQNVPEIIKQRSIWRNLGLTSSEIDEVTAENVDTLSL